MNRFELADAMIKGLQAPNVKEETMAYVHTSKKSGFCRACALGCALIGYYDGNYRQAEAALDRGGSVQGDIARALGISTDLAVEIEFRHLNGMPVQQIAAWLKSSEGGEV